MHFLVALGFENVTNGSQGSQGRSPNFKDDVKLFYGLPKHGDLFDMATGQTLRHGSVIGAHIFQWRWRSSLPLLSSFTNIDHVRNALLLYKPVEDAFDRARLCVEVNGESLRFRLLDEAYQMVRLSDRAAELRKKGNPNAGMMTQAEMAMTATFGDLDGRELFFPQGCTNRPSKRLLVLHARASLLFAKVNYLVPEACILRLDREMSVSSDPITSDALQKLSLSW